MDKEIGMTSREQKGLEIAESGRMTPFRNLWLVPASKQGKKYTVDPVTGHCSCPDHQLRKLKCKHLYAVELTISRQVTTTHERKPDGSVTVIKTETVTKAARVTYRQNWTAYNAAQTEEKRRFGELLGDLCSHVPEPERADGPGRPRLPLADMAFACVYKVAYVCADSLVVALETLTKNGSARLAAAIRSAHDSARRYSLSQ